MKKLILLLLGLVPSFTTTVLAQRLGQPLGRGVVAVQNAGSVTVSWRRLAQEPEQASYNLYVDGQKVNAEPLTHTHFTTTTQTVPVGSQVAVSLVVDGREGELSVPYTLRQFDCRNMFMSIRFDGSPLQASSYSTSYVWPADLDGDGEMDYVVNRISTTSALDCYVEGYLRDGEHLWTVRLGPNELSCSGQDDMVLAYDMDCDGKAEVVVQTSDGTQFWDPQARDFGLYVNGSTTGDTDGDGIIDYETQTVRNAPRYMSVVDGLTGQEKCSVEQTYNSAYNRTNRAALMGDEYNKHVGHVGVFYHDGIHPAVVMEWHTRNTDGSHNYHNSAFAFDFAGGKAGQWREIFCKPTYGPAFHQIRIADVDGDGRDEMTTGGYTMDHDGEKLNSPGIAHGDRFRTTDIDPERPGLETFAIQQNAGDMLGQILYDAATGEPIKKWYLSAVGDVGRGECLDIDPTHKGWEMWSTMGGIYDAKGELIPGLTAPYPTEGIWWDDELDREIVQTSDSHHNVYVQDFHKGRLIEIAKISGYRYITVYAKRAAFWGDIVGDWREELVLLHMEDGVCVGIAGFATDYDTDVDYIYCLQEDPAYRMQCTTKGYYQSPNPGFYLGYGMPRPPLPPCMATDVVWQSSQGFTDYERASSATYADGQSVLIDLYTEARLDVDQDMSPSVLYAMPVKGQTVTLAGSGRLTGNMSLWKSQAGTLAADIPLAYSGTTVVSEGTLELNTEISGPVELRARGTLAGHGAVNDITFEGALHHEGCRLMPNGSLTFKKGLTINNKVYAQLDLPPTDDAAGGDRLMVEGDLCVAAPVVFNFVSADGDPQPGCYRLVEYSGTFEGSLDRFSIEGLKGLHCEVADSAGAICLVVHPQRQPTEGVQWTGAESNTWDYASANFALPDGASTNFVAQDAVVFADGAQRSGTILVNELLPTSGITVDNDADGYLFNGQGGFSGSGGLTKRGSGTLNLYLTHSDYTGPTIIEEGTVAVSSLADGGAESPLGAASTDAQNLQIGKATLAVTSNNTATNRGITLTDSATLQIHSGTTALKGIVTGGGTLIKSGNGQLNLNYEGTNTYGGTVLNAGTLAMGTWNTTFGQPTSTITANGGTISIFDNNSTSAVPRFRNTLHIPAGKSVTLQGGRRCSIEGKLTGQGTLRISFPYVRGDVSTDMSQFEGTLSITSGQFRLTQATNLSKATVEMGDGVYMAHVNGGSSTEVNLTTRMGALASTSSTATLGTGTYEIGHSNDTASYAGTYTTAARITKVGTGLWTLSHSALPTGITVAGGTLALTAEAAMTGTAVVRNGGLLDLLGTAGHVNIQQGGLLAAGNALRRAVTGYVDGNLTMAEGAVVRVKKVSTRHDGFQVAGAVTLHSPVIEVNCVRGDYADGEELAVFEGFTSLTVDGEVSILPAVPCEGMEWDLSTFATDATLRVKTNGAGIASVAAGDIALTPNPTDGPCLVQWPEGLGSPVTVEVVDLQGQTLHTETLPAGQHQCRIDLGPLPGGVYFVVVKDKTGRQSHKVIRK